MSRRQQPPPPGLPERVEQEAIAWFTRMNGHPSTSDRRNFERWRQADPLHARAYCNVEALWASTSQPGAQVAAEESARLEAYLRAMDRAKRKRHGTNTGITVAGALLAIVLGTWIWLDHPNFVQDLRADFVTARSERRTVVLTDGSTVLLDADSALVETPGTAERRVRLLRGTAFFDVKTSSAPFVVEAAEGETRVLGTQFDVAIEDDDVVVTLAKGAVEISMDADDRRAALAPGQSVSYGRAGIGAVEDVVIDDATAWRGGRFVFNNARLRDVVNRIQRYRSGRIVIIGQTLADHRVSGSFSLDDSDAALASLQSTVGFRMTGLAGRLVVITR